MHYIAASFFKDNSLLHKANGKAIAVYLHMYAYATATDFGDGSYGTSYLYGFNNYKVYRLMRQRGIYCTETQINNSINELINLGLLQKFSGNDGIESGYKFPWTTITSKNKLYNTKDLMDIEEWMEVKETVQFLKMHRYFVSKEFYQLPVREKRLCLYLYWRLSNSPCIKLNLKDRNQKRKLTTMLHVLRPGKVQKTLMSVKELSLFDVNTLTDDKKQQFIISKGIELDEQGIITKDCQVILPIVPEYGYKTAKDKVIASLEKEYSYTLNKTERSILLKYIWIFSTVKLKGILQFYLKNITDNTLKKDLNNVCFSFLKKRVCT